MATFEIRRYNSPIPFLACGIPNIQFGRFTFQCNILDPEINCGHLGTFLGMELALDESPE